MPGRVRGGAGEFLMASPADGAVLMPPRGTEFVHLHADGSLHLALHPDDQAAVLGADWGERHPLYHPRRANALMVYAPRDEDEHALVQEIVTASYRYATGRLPQPAPTAVRTRQPHKAVITA
ncbi:luciferase domain-containing protein [Streptomyces sp. URMC 123]|uniref:luciferase domain-containing protein n=1 Tax=Streptomyces sp. URMC 123 TaxID=3423403 RepID=UPI003F1CC462